MKKELRITINSFSVWICFDRMISSDDGYNYSLVKFDSNMLPLVVAEFRKTELSLKFRRRMNNIVYFEFANKEVK